MKSIITRIFYYNASFEEITNYLGMINPQGFVRNLARFGLDTTLIALLPFYSTNDATVLRCRLLLIFKSLNSSWYESLKNFLAIYLIIFRRIFLRLVGFRKALLSLLPFTFIIIRIYEVIS